MKKLLMLLVCTTVGLSLRSQSIKNLVPIVEKKMWLHSLRLYPLEKGTNIEDENHYVFRCSLDDNYFYTINSTGASCSPKFELPEDYSFRKAFETDNDIIGIYTYFNKGTAAFYINSFDKKRPSWKPKEIFSFSSIDNKDNFNSYIGISQDNTKFCVCTILTDKKDNFKSLEIFVFDKEGEKLWQNSISPDFSKRTFKINDIALSNEGTAYLCITSYNDSKNKSSDEKVHLYEVGESEFNSYEGSDNIGYIADAQLKILKNGNVFIGGYYADKKDDICKGSFCLLYGIKEKTVLNFSHSQFPSSYDKNDIESLQFNQIIELSNGNIVTLGEQRDLFVFYSQNGTSYKFLTGNIIYSSFTNSGTVENYQIIRKKQEFPSYAYVSDIKTFCLSFYAFEKNGAIYLLFNDNIANNDIHSESVKMINPTRSGNVAVRLVKINGEEMSSEVLINGKTDKKTLRALLFVNDNNLIISCLGKAVTIDNISINF